MMMLETGNNIKLNTSDIPCLSIDEVKREIRNKNLRPVEFFGKQEYDNRRLYITAADDKSGKLYVCSVLFGKDVDSYESFTQEFTAFHMFEREFYEEFGIKPLNHPWLKPVRKNLDEYPFFKMEGDEVHEVAVGPVHAGIIEPGHFRFMCRGEKVYNLEIMLGYQHRGVEELIINSNGYNNRLAESICGDSVIAYNIAYSKVTELLSGTVITKKAEIIRKIALELERTAVHIGDMGAISGDMAYLQGASIFGVTRTLVINTMLEISGSRFGRGLIETGGVNFDIDDKLSEKIVKMLAEVEKRVDITTNTIINKPSCISRMEKTGVVGRETAKALGATGIAAKASGVYIDSRFDFDGYKRYDEVFEPSGDVFARFIVRYNEIKSSIKMIKEFLSELKNHQGEELRVIPGKIQPNMFVSVITEGWRGQIVHSAVTGNNSEILRYKITDPSFNNWYMLSIAVRNNGVSDFPLCNKSFNLSYCGFDL